MLVVPGAQSMALLIWHRALSFFSVFSEYIILAKAQLVHCTPSSVIFYFLEFKKPRIRAAARRGGGRRGGCNREPGMNMKMNWFVLIHTAFHSLFTGKVPRVINDKSFRRTVIDRGVVLPMLRIFFCREMDWIQWSSASGYLGQGARARVLWMDEKPNSPQEMSSQSSHSSWPFAWYW